jgi:hypothetical protein
MGHKFSERYTYEELITLIDLFKVVGEVKQLVKSHPGDILREVYYVKPTLKISITENGFNLESIPTDEHDIKNNTIRAERLKMIQETSLNNMPLYINDKNEIIRTIATWRLNIGK